MDLAPATETAPDYRRVVIASVFALLLGSAITVLIHECGHWVAGALLGNPSTLYSFAVSHAGEMTPQAVAIAALAGPAVSLVLGLLMTYWTPLRTRGGTAHLLWLWVGFTSLQEAVAYLVITPFGAGDTAVANDALGGGFIAAMVALALGILGMFWQARRFAGHVARFAGEDLRLARSYAWFPWLIAIGWMVAVQVVMLSITPMTSTLGEKIIIAIASIAMTVFAPMSFIFLGKLLGNTPVEPLRLPPFPTGLAIGYALMLILGVVLAFAAPTIG